MLTNNLENKPMNQWAELNRLLFIYKLVGISFGFISVLLVLLCFVLSSKKPIVALAAGNDYFYVKTERAQVDLSEGNIRRFVERYVKGLYAWRELDPEKITREIAPLVTDGFREKALLSLTEKKIKVFAGKKISQDISGLTIDVTKENTTAVFDVVLKIDDMPVVVPTQILFQLVKGIVTEWNPIGLYVNGITVHEGK